MAKKQSKNSHKADHLKPHQFKPGRTGNPKGRRQGSLSLTSQLRKALNEGDGKRGKKIIDAMIEHAEAGDIRHIKEILERIDGKVADKVESDGTVEVVVRHVEMKPDEAIDD